MNSLVFGGETLSDLKVAFSAHGDESCALLLAAEANDNRGSARLLVREIHLLADDAYSKRSPVEAEIRPEALVPLIQRAKNEDLSVVFAHSHPNSIGTPVFSEVDDMGEAKLADFLARRIPKRTHAAIVIGSHGCAARILGAGEPISVLEVNTTVKDWTEQPTAKVHDRWDRQIRAFGSAGQAAIQRTKVAIVGLGGTGSIVAQELAYLGVADFTLVDHDVADETNLNRLVGATQDNVGQHKVEVAQKMISNVNPSAKIQVIAGDVANIDVARSLVGCDAIFSCTDSHASRAILNQLAYQFLTPLFDVGVGIVVKNGDITHVTGRIQMASPGLPCLICAGVVDSNAVRIELQSEIHRAADPYITGHHEPQPAVISLNGTVSSMVVTMFMAAFAGLPMATRLQYYNGLLGTVRAATLRADASCIVCSRSGALARGDAWQLFGRVSR
ncbi:MAG: ThiF family adenylyltransferase [Nitrospira sp.]|nr:ThiF family adenylyltransferase [Nitrospira sp.]